MSVVVNLQHFKWIVPGFVIVGTAPCYLAVWGAWRLLSAALPYRIYQQGDDTLWAIYQRLVLFFFETYSGTEVNIFYFIILGFYLLLSLLIHKKEEKTFCFCCYFLVFKFDFFFFKFLKFGKQIFEYTLFTTFQIKNKICTVSHCD